MVLQTAKVSIISETGKFLPDFLQKRAQRGDSPLGSTFTHKLCCTLCWPNTIFLCFVVFLAVMAM